MFEEHFGFRTRPFGRTPDPAFLYESDQHREALARLEFAVEEKDLALLVGDVGSGKTTLSRALIDRVGDSRPVVLLINPRLSPAQLLRSIAAGLGLSPARLRNELLDQIHTKLFELYEAKREPVVIIDEAQLIPSKATFDEIRLLTNFQLDDQNLLTLILIGQPELQERLRREAYKALRQRIGLRYSLGPLSLEETIAYIEHRIAVAGGQRNPFDAEAMAEIHAMSGGIPRLINTLATTALLDAFGEDAETVDAGRVSSAAREHQMDEPFSPRGRREGLPMVNLAKLRKKAKEKKEKPVEIAREIPVETAEPAPVEPPQDKPVDKIAAYLAVAGSKRGEIRREEAIRSGEEIELLTFVIAGEQYAIDIENVVEIVTPRPVTKIPNANASVVGILSLRGTIVILVDARGTLGHPPATAIGPDARIVVVQHDSENIGFMVDRVLRVAKVEPHEIQPHPVAHSSEHDEAVRGVFRQGGALTIVLDFSKLIFNRNEWN